MGKSIYYSNNQEPVQLYDIVRIKIGHWKDDLAIIDYVDRIKRIVKISNIRNGIKLILSVRNVEFCYHNTKAAAKQWYQQMNYNTEVFLGRYKDINYIANNWFVDKFVVNNITAETILKWLGHDTANYDKDDFIKWINNNKDIIDIVNVYPNADFCYKFIINYISVADRDMVYKLHKLFNDVKNGDGYLLAPSPTGEHE